MDADVLIEYFSKMNPVTQGVEGRIRFETDAERKAKCLESGIVGIKGEAKQPTPPLPLTNSEVDLFLGTPIPILLQAEQETTPPGKLMITEPQGVAEPFKLESTVVAVPEMQEEAETTTESHSP